MSEMERAALVMLGAASDLYNDAEILRDAIEHDEHDQFSAEYIRIEGERVLDTARNLEERIKELLVHLKVEVDE